MTTSSNDEWSIGELAHGAGVTVRALHHYDRLGLLKPSGRSQAGYRRYSSADVERLYQLLALRRLGFRLREIRPLLDDANEDELLITAQQHLHRVESELAALQQLRKRLRALLNSLQAAGSSPTELLETMEAMSMTVHLSRIYTRKGDKGTTRLGDKTVTSKTDPRIEAIGNVDELSSQLGLIDAIAPPSDGRYADWLHQIQNELYDVGADLAVPTGDNGRSRLRISTAYVDRLESMCDEANTGLPPLRSFVLPGGAPTQALLHVARTVCRRAERSVAATDDVNPEILRYLNRLSDLLFILARAVNEGSEPLWQPGKTVQTTCRKSS
jgi:cob(I)alamin adenosyltransferase